MLINHSRTARLGPPLLAAAILLGSVLTGCGRQAAGPATPAPVQEAAKDAAPAPKPEDSRPKSPISGLPYDKEDVGPLVAVMVENHRDARPQSGLIGADLVYEALAEGGISRFMALYYGQAPKVIGPVRSARPYYVLYAQEWDAIYAHAGGDPKDLEPIKQYAVTDADEINNAGEAFWRSSERKAPHNLYTSVEKLRDHTQRAYPRRSSTRPAARWQFVPWAESPAQGLTIKYGSDYQVAYKLEDGIYRRYMNGKLHQDKETGEPLAVTNVMIQYAATRVAYPDGGLKIDLVTKGQAQYLLGGRMLKGTWEKRDLASATRFLDESGQPVALTAGQTWIQIVPTGTPVTFESAD